MLWTHNSMCSQTELFLRVCAFTLSSSYFFWRHIIIIFETARYSVCVADDFLSCDLLSALERHKKAQIRITKQEETPEASSQSHQI